MLKRVFIVSLVMLYSMTSFASVISDNDGSAFITKTEFDSLKNEFSNQIEQYNVSIDSKIEGAIASYLAGAKLSESHPDWTNLYESNQFVFYGDEIVTNIPYTEYRGTYTYICSRNDLGGYGPWHGNLIFKTIAESTDEIGYCIGVPNNDKSKFYLTSLKYIPKIIGGFVYYTNGTNNTAENSYLAQNGGSTYLLVTCNGNESTGKTWVVSQDYKMSNSGYNARNTHIQLNMHAWNDIAKLGESESNNIKYYDIKRYENSSSTAVVTDNSNVMVGSMTSGTWAVKDSGLSNKPKMPVSQNNTSKFFCINPDADDVNFYFDGLVPEVKTTAVTAQVEMLLASLVSGSIQKRRMVTNQVGLLDFDRLRRYNNETKSSLQNSYWNWSKNFVVSPPSGYFVADKVMQSVKCKNEDVNLANGVLISAESLGEKLTLYVSCSSTSATDVIKIAAAKEAFENGLTTSNPLEINGSTSPVTLEQNKRIKLDISTSKDDPCYIMVTSDEGKNINFEIISGVWTVSESD